MKKNNFKNTDIHAGFNNYVFARGMRQTRRQYNERKTDNSRQQLCGRE